MIPLIKVLAVLLALSSQYAWGAMHISRDGRAEVLIFPFYSALGSDNTALTISNSTGYVKAVKVTVREGLNGQPGLQWFVYLGPYDAFSFTVSADPEGDGAVISPFASELTCTVPSFRGRSGVYFEQPMFSRLWEGDSFNGLERNLSGYVEVIELGQWDPFSGVKGPAASRGASGSYADCEILVDAWSRIFDVEGDWLRNSTDEALSWRGGGLTGYAIVRSSAATLRYDALGIAEFARYRFKAEYHDYPGGTGIYWPAPSLNSGSTLYEQTIGSSVVRQTATEGRDAISALLSKTIIQSNVPARNNTVQSWVVNYPTKHLHTKYSSWLGPFSETWNSTLSRSCDYVELGDYSQSDNEFETLAHTELCGAVNLVNNSRSGQAPFAFPQWLTASVETSAASKPNAMRSGYRSKQSERHDRSITVETKYASDTRIIGMPMVAIPIYFDVFGDAQVGAFDASTLRIYERIATAFESAEYSTETATVTLATVNLSGLEIVGHQVLCRDKAGATNVKGESASPPFSPAPPITVQVSPVVNGEQYICEAFAITDSGRGELSAEFVLNVPPEPRAPVVSGYDWGDGEIYLFVSSPSDGDSDIAGYTATCTDGTNSFMGSGLSSPIIVSGLTNDAAYTCTVTATNQFGTSVASEATDPITPEETSAGLPIWLLYQAIQ